jgi:hypothetical protein
MRRHRLRLSSVAAIGMGLLLFLAAGALLPNPDRPGSPEAAALTPTAPVPLAPGGNFSTYLGDEARTSSATNEVIINSTSIPGIHLLWNYSVGSPVQSQPIVQNGTLFFGAENGYEYALSTVGGALLWRTYLGQDRNDTACGSEALGVSSTSGYLGGKLYAVGGYPVLYALNVSTGAIDWDKNLSGSDSLGVYDWSSPLLYKGAAYVGISSECGNPMVKAGLDEVVLKTHVVTEGFNSSRATNGSEIRASAAVDPTTNTIFVATGAPYSNSTKYSESIIPLNATTLQPVGNKSFRAPTTLPSTGGAFEATPTVYDPAGGVPMVADVNLNGSVYGIVQSNMTKAWTQKICCSSGETDNISLAWGGGMLYAVTPATQLGGVTYGSTARAINPLTGKSEWSVGFSQSSAGGYAAPLWVNGVLIVADQGSLLFLNASTGQLISEFNGSGDFQAPASVSRGEVYAASSNGVVYAFDLMLDASAVESTTTGSAPLTVTFSATGTGGLPQYTYAWQFGDGSSSVSQNPQYTFATRGIYSINVTVTDLAGTQATAHLQLTVLPSTAPLPSPKPVGLFGLPRDVGYAIIGGVAALILLFAAIVLVRRRRAPGPGVASRRAPSAKWQGPPAQDPSTGSGTGGRPPEPPVY